MMKRSTVETTAGIFVLIGILCVGYLTIKLGRMEWVGGDYYSVYAKFQSVSGLTKGAKVEISGVQIGSVDEISLDQKRMIAMVRMKIKKGLALTDDAIASIKTSGLIGDKYIRISQGGSENLVKPGDTLTETESAIDLEELISKYVFGKV
jgi:phospholipid/cholesterol/gamma-HCH transport system substrate-binding protein